MKKLLLLIATLFAIVLTGCMSTNNQVAYRSEITEQSVLIDAGNLLIPGTLFISISNLIIGAHTSC